MNLNKIALLLGFTVSGILVNTVFAPTSLAATVTYNIKAFI